MQQFLTSSKGEIHGEKNLGTKFEPKRVKSGPKLDFCHFLKFGALVFFEIAYNDSFQQCIIFSIGETHEKNFWAKIGSETGFFCHFVRFGSLVFLEIVYNDSLQQFLTSRRDEILKKNLWGPNLGQNWAKN